MAHLALYKRGEFDMPSTIPRSSWAVIKNRRFPKMVIAKLPEISRDASVFALASDDRRVNNILCLFIVPMLHSRVVQSRYRVLDLSSLLTSVELSLPSATSVAPFYKSCRVRALNDQLRIWGRLLMESTNWCSSGMDGATTSTSTT